MTPPRETVVQSLLGPLADEHRRVLADWRAWFLLRRAEQRVPVDRRRWAKAPRSLVELHGTLRRLAEQGHLRALADVAFLYEVTAPYARVLSEGVEEEEIVMEVHPFAALGYSSAMRFHELTLDLPRDIHVLEAESRAAGPLPIGTTDEDWAGLEEVARAVVARRPTTLRGTPVHWHQTSLFVGIGEYRPHGYPVRVTTPERTLLDGLMHPAECGGFASVLRAWVTAKDTLHLEVLVELVERFDIAILRQRAGFVLEELGLSHGLLAGWQKRARRGGSSKLVATEPYASVWSERWSLSLNSSIQPLHEAAP